MRKGSSEKVVRRNYTFPESFAQRLAKLKKERGVQSESELVRQAIKLLEACTNENQKITLVDKKGKKTRLIVL